MTLGRDSDSELEQQRASVEADFREGWVPAGVGEPRVLTKHDYAEARKVLSNGGWTGLDRATIEAVREGARPGDSLPPLRPSPFISRVTEADVIVHGDGPGRRVVVLFAHRHFPGVRFGHRLRLEPSGKGLEPILLKEEIETGALHRMMQNEPVADDTGVIWTTWGD